MTFFSKLFGKTAASPKSSEPAASREPLVPVPALGVLLLNLEKNKGSALTEPEVLEIRDKAACIMLPLSAKRAMDEKRGYEDINPENAWIEWLVFRTAARGNEP